MRKVDHKLKARRLEQYKKIQPSFESKAVVTKVSENAFYAGMYLTKLNDHSVYWLATQRVQEPSEQNPLGISTQAHFALVKRSGLVGGDTIHVVPMLGFSTGDVGKIRKKIFKVLSFSSTSHEPTFIVFITPTAPVIDKIHRIMGCLGVVNGTK